MKESKTSSCGRTRERWVPKIVWGPWNDTGDTDDTCANRRKKQSSTSNYGGTKTRWVSDKYGDETWPTDWKDTDEERGSGNTLQMKQSKTSSCGRTRERWVPKIVWGPWEYTGETSGTCATFKREQSSTSNCGDTKTRLERDAYGDETWPDTWTDTGEKRGSGADREKKQSRTSSCSRTRTQWVDDPEETPTPLSAPTWSSAPSHKSYRWFTIDWGGNYSDYEIQWREQHTAVWFVLAQSGTSGPRALLTGTSADVRGIPYRDGSAVELKVIGITENGRRSPPSDIAIYSHTRLDANGHQHDHRVAYDISPVGFGTVGTMTRAAVSAAVANWQRLFSGVRFCVHPCGAGVNTDGKVITVENALTEGLPHNGTTGNVRCLDSVACLEDIPRGANVETHVGNHPLVIEEPAFYGRGHNGSPYRKVRWTHDPDKHNQPTGESYDERWKYIDRTVTHEFGHALGLEDIGYPGIMGTANEITSADIDRLREIYDGHTRGEGW